MTKLTSLLTSNNHSYKLFKTYHELHARLLTAYNALITISRQEQKAFTITKTHIQKERLCLMKNYLVHVNY
jgi:hypothetical protein